jgi:hypothetical protein
MRQPATERRLTLLGRRLSEAGAKELERYRKLVEAALNDVTAKACALAGADMTRATPPSIAKSPIAKSPS